MLEQVPVALRRHDPEVEAQPVVRDHRRLRPALRDDLRHPLEPRERVDQRLRVGRGGDHVEVAERLAATADAARLGYLLRRRVGAERLDRREHRGQTLAEQRPRRRLRLRALAQRLEDVLLDLGPESGERPQPLLLGRLAEAVERGHVELLPDPSSGLGAEAGQAHEGDHVRRNPPFPLRERLDLALLDDLDDLLLDRLPDPLELLGLPVECELRDRAARLADPLGGASVREHPERFRPLELEHVGEQLELLDHLCVPRQRHSRDHRQRAQSHGLPPDVQRAREPRADGRRAPRPTRPRRHGAGDRRQLPGRHRRARRPAGRAARPRRRPPPSA